MNRILLEESDLETECCARIDGTRAAHLKSILRVREGSEIRIGLVNGPTGKGRIHSIRPGEIRIECRWDAHPPPSIGIHLILAMPRPKVMKRMWPVLGSLGLDRIVILRAWKVEKAYFSSDALEPSRIRSGLLKGLSQAGETRLPEVLVRKEFRPFIEDELETWAGSGPRLLADPGAPNLALPPSPSPCIQTITAALGPEGGWTDYERGALAAHGFQPAGLGPRILRTDVACIALLTRIHAASETEMKFAPEGMDLL